MADDIWMRIVKGAEYLANPLLKPEEKAKAMKLYDALVDEATKEMNYRKNVVKTH